MSTNTNLSAQTMNSQLFVIYVPTEGTITNETLDRLQAVYGDPLEKKIKRPVLVLPVGCTIETLQFSFDVLDVSLDVGKMPSEPASKSCKNVAEGLKSSMNVPIVVIPVRS